MCDRAISLCLIKTSKRRDNALQWPLDPLQVIAWVGMIMMYLEFPLFTAMVLHRYALIPTGLVSICRHKRDQQQVMNNNGRFM